MHTVLIVDENKKISNAVAKCFNLSGFAALTANSTEKARYILENFKVSVAVVEMSLKKDCTSNLIRDFGTRLPIVATSDGAQDLLEMDSLAKTYGASLFVQKPFSSDIIVKRAMSCL